MYECKICKSEHKTLCGIAKHIIKSHNMKSKEYYDIYLKKEKDGVCIICGKETQYVNITSGYRKTCGNSCGCTNYRTILRMDEEKFNAFRDKVSKNQTNIWLNRDDVTKNEILNKTLKKNKEARTLLTNTQLSQKYGWLNKLEGEEREQKINYILDKSLRKWWSEATLEQKLLVYEKHRKIMLGDRYTEDIYNDFIQYKNKVYSQSNMTYRKYKDVINPNNYKRGIKGDKYQLDHKYSVVQGWIDKIPIEIMSSIHNLEMLTITENNKKRINCSISKEELYELCKKNI